MRPPPKRTICCNGADPPKRVSLKSVIRLDYRGGHDSRVRLRLPDFVRRVGYVAPRILDLLEIAAYVYCGDRLVDRGARDLVEYHSWGRHLSFRIRVRDVAFWSDPSVRNALGSLLQFLMGDEKIEFIFQGGHGTGAAGLFDREEFAITKPKRTQIALFSGGLDSLAGALRVLHDTSDSVCLVGHESGNPATWHVRRALADELESRYPARVQFYQFECGLSGGRGPEESQRSRGFLFLAIGCALGVAVGASALEVFENGVTSLNLQRRQDLINARSSRTTHPRVVMEMEQLFRSVAGSPFAIHTPMMWYTKAEVVREIVRTGGTDLIPRSVSCGMAINRSGGALQCGVCYQCIDRRIALISAGRAEVEPGGMYQDDFVTQGLAGEHRTRLVDYIRQASAMAHAIDDAFWNEHASELALALNALGVRGNTGPADTEVRLRTLLAQHADDVRTAIRILLSKADPFEEKPEGSLLAILGSGEFQRPVPELFAERLAAELPSYLLRVFEHHTPLREDEVNDAIHAYLNTHKNVFLREFPLVRVAGGLFTPDHVGQRYDISVEGKFVRDKSPPSVARSGIAEDLGLGRGTAQVFVVFDPHRKIREPKGFSRDLEARGALKVIVVR